MNAQQLYEKATTLSFHGEKEKSKELYLRLVSEFPESEQAQHAKVQLGMIDAEKEESMPEEEPAWGTVPYCLLYGFLLNIVAIPAFFITLFGLVQLFGKAPVFPGGEVGLLSAGFLIVGVPYLFVALLLMRKLLAGKKRVRS